MKGIYILLCEPSCRDKITCTGGVRGGGGGGGGTDVPLSVVLASPAKTGCAAATAGCEIICQHKNVRRFSYGFHTEFLADRPRTMAAAAGVYAVCGGDVSSSGFFRLLNPRVKRQEKKKIHKKHNKNNNNSDENNREKKYTGIGAKTYRCQNNTSLARAYVYIRPRCRDPYRRGPAAAVPDAPSAGTRRGPILLLLPLLLSIRPSPV